jgi:hypothetical protein
MPMSRVPSTTSSEPMFCRFIICAASSTVADLTAVTVCCAMMVDGAHGHVGAEIVERDRH